jgi:predicted DNA-binding protein (MmcQ/YjbR family)
MTSPRSKSAGPKSGPFAELRAFALSFPDAYEEFPWGHCAIKVNKKIFVSLVGEDGDLSMSLKLVDSNFEALLLPFTEPTHYGMGKHGWVTSKFAAKASPPMEILRVWIEESFRAVATKRIVKRLDEDGLAAPKSVRKQAKKKAKKKAKKRATKKT